MTHPTHMYGRLDPADFADTDGATQPVSHVIGSNWPGSRSVARKISTRPSYLARLSRWVRCTALRWQIRSTEEYVADCEFDGVLDTNSLREFRRQLEIDRCRLAQLEAGR